MDQDVNDCDTFNRLIADGTIDDEQRFVYDPMTKPDLADIVLVFDGSGSLRHRYLHGPDVDQVLADEDSSGNVLWPLADHLGTIRDVAEYNSGTDTTSVVNHLVYDAFGRITSQSNSTLTPLFAFTAREWDADTDLFYYRARWYDAQVGRFLSEDPIGFNGYDANLYSYVHNSPAMLADPSGLDGLNRLRAFRRELVLALVAKSRSAHWQSVHGTAQQQTISQRKPLKKPDGDFRRNDVIMIDVMHGVTVIGRVEWHMS